MKKMTMIVVVLATLMTAVFLGLAGSADASCSKTGYIIRVSTNPGTTNSLIYFRTSATSNVYFYGRTNDSKLIDAALTALTSRTRVSITGNATSCPSSGNVGTITYLAVSP